MRDLTESNVTEAVLDKIADDTNPRLKEIMTALIRHTHDFVREVNLSSDELLYAARFIQNVGQISDDKREEGVLLGDVLLPGGARVDLDLEVIPTSTAGTKRIVVDARF